MTELRSRRKCPSLGRITRVCFAPSLHHLGLLDTHQTGSQFPDRSNELHWFPFGSSTSIGSFSILPLGMHAPRGTSGNKRRRDTESVHRTTLRREDAPYRTASTRCWPSKGLHRPCTWPHRGRARQRF